MTISEIPQESKSLVIARIFDAPRKDIWEAWIKPEQLMKWWGPKDYTIPTCTIDLNIGGKYLYCMRSPEGKNFWGTGTYKEITPLKQLVLTDSFADENGNVVPASYYEMGEDFPLELQIKITFEEQGAKTKMTLEHTGIPQGQQMMELTKASWGESFDKLEESLK